MSQDWNGMAPVGGDKRGYLMHWLKRRGSETYTAARYNPRFGLWAFPGEAGERSEREVAAEYTYHGRCLTPDETAPAPAVRDALAFLVKLHFDPDIDCDDEQWTQALDAARAALGAT